MRESFEAIAAAKTQTAADASQHQDRLVAAITQAAGSLLPAGGIDCFGSTSTTRPSAVQYSRNTLQSIPAYSGRPGQDPLDVFL